MIEEFLYLDTGQPKISAASVGISNKRWTCIKIENIDIENYKEIMSKYRFDVLPIQSAENTSEYFITAKPNQYETILRKEITHEDILSYDSSIREVIKTFAKEKRSFYFLTYRNKINGLITVGNLNCRLVQVFLFGLICEIERLLCKLIETNVDHDELIEYLITKSVSDKNIKQALENYEKQKSIEMENTILEHLYFQAFLDISYQFNLHSNLKYESNKWKEFNEIKVIRNLVAHPAKSLIDNKNNINKLWRRIQLMEELIFRLHQI